MLLNHIKGPVPEYSCITVFTTALCNLNCSYCYICKDKNGGLKQIDDEVEESFKNNGYIKQVLDLDPKCHDTITQLSLWGGEPFLGIYRFIDHIEDYFKNFPHINAMDFSTNLTLPDHPKRIKDLMDALDKYYYLLDIPEDKKFTIRFQISIDGYEEFNDTTRGKGTTKKIFDNWKKLLEILDIDDTRFILNITTKSTFSKDTWKFVNTPEKAYKWCESIDKNLWQPWQNSKLKNKVHYCHGFWNNAMPTEYCQQDGIEYAKVSKAFFDVREKVVAELPSFKDYDTIVSEAIEGVKYLEDNKFDKEAYFNEVKCKRCGMGCGVFAYNLVPIPNNKFTMCHRGFFDSYIEYSNNLKNQEHLNGLANLWTSVDAKKFWVLNKKQITQMHNTISKLYEYPNQIYYTDLIQQIKYYADSGLIDEKYKDINNIIPTLNIFLITPQCIQDDFIFGGTWVTRTPLEIPLYWNGSMDIITKEIDRIWEKGQQKKYEKIQRL